MEPDITQFGFNRRASSQISLPRLAIAYIEMPATSRIVHHERGLNVPIGDSETKLCVACNPMHQISPKRILVKARSSPPI